MSLWIEGHEYSGHESVPTLRILRASYVTVLDRPHDRRWTLSRGRVAPCFGGWDAWWSLCVWDVMVELVDSVRFVQGHDYAAVSLERWLTGGIEGALRARFPGMPYTVDVGTYDGRESVRDPRDRDRWLELNRVEGCVGGALATLCEIGVVRRRVVDTTRMRDAVWVTRGEAGA